MVLRYCKALISRGSLEGGAKESEGEKGEGSLNNFLKFITGSGGRGYVWDVEFLENKKKRSFIVKIFFKYQTEYVHSSNKKPRFQCI